MSLNPAIDGFATAAAIRALRKIQTIDEHYHAGGGIIFVAAAVMAPGVGGCRAVDVERLYAANLPASERPAQAVGG